MRLPLVLTLLFDSILLTHAHGSLKAISVGNKEYLAWQIRRDDYDKSTPVRYSRRILNEGPVKDFTGKGITCGDAGNVPSKGTIPVSPGAKVTFVWDQWGSSHSGPVMNYLAKCTPDCRSFKGDSGPVWVKIEQMGFNKTSNPQWGSDKLARQGAKWYITIPRSLAPGEYLLRHEILGLHVAGKRMGAQFYPNCVQIKVSGSGTAQLPRGVALPGAYSPDDRKGILVELWRVNQGQVQYVPPGGPVWKG